MLHVSLARFTYNYWLFMQALMCHRLMGYTQCSTLVLQVVRLPGGEHINPSLIRQVVVSASKQLVLNYSCLAIYHLMA